MIDRATIAPEIVRLARFSAKWHEHVRYRIVSLEQHASRGIPRFLSLGYLFIVYFCSAVYREPHEKDLNFALFPHYDSHGMSRSGNEYGPLTDLPDWSYTSKFTNHASSVVHAGTNPLLIDCYI